MKEEKRVFRLYFAWDYQREEAWLNQMAEEGWALEESNGLRYRFRRSQPGQWVVRLDRPAFSMDSQEGQEYLDLIQESGAQWVGGINRWIYLRRPAALGPFSVYSDLAGEEALLLRARRQILIPGVLLFLLLVLAIGGAVRGDRALLPALITWAVVLGMLTAGLIQLQRQLGQLRRERRLRE
ncbi:MAG: DUF2812 domain-containing protein [Evtepia sp.]|uniref:DUF2812 domain-containing protein n=1 Tax=Evtepia sp. TaxID=2773933 RepID=UPI002A749231|nr:DUF2812 domain-containing protein [Evtepia sp.]MDY3014223.1 DUF2812 domain-containing protein [Evtepia sp.]